MPGSSLSKDGGPGKTYRRFCHGLGPGTIGRWPPVPSEVRKSLQVRHLLRPISPLPLIASLSRARPANRAEERRSRREARCFGYAAFVCGGLLAFAALAGLAEAYLR